MKIDVKQGKGGRWRWHIRDHRGALLAQSGPKGFEREPLAHLSAVEVTRLGLGDEDAPRWWEYLLGGFGCAAIGLAVGWLVWGLS